MNLAGEFLILKLHILPPEPVTLGIGVGGNILQEIKADTSDPRMWDVANSKILYIHIVNSRDFKTITGVPPPETPVSWKQYSDLGLPYEKEWEHEDSKSKGINFKGAFDKLVSLEEVDEDVDVDEDEDEDQEEDEEEESKLWPDEEDDGNKYDLRKVPGYPLVLLETDQTVPWFRASTLKPREGY